MHEVASLAMLCDGDISALRVYLRTHYRTERQSCCLALLSISYMSFERLCRASLKLPATEAFGAHVCDGLKLEYCAQRVVVKRSHALMPAAGAGRGLGGALQWVVSRVQSDDV